jgi:hypothetical protein
VTEKAGGGGLYKPPTGKEMRQSFVRELACLLEAVEGFVGPKQAVGPACPPVGFGEGRKVCQARRNNTSPYACSYRHFPSHVSQ